ncbi:MAG: ABC transporter permease [Planctomycetia bacterium]
MGFALTLALRSLLRRKARTLFSILGVALGIATTVVVFVLDHNTILGLSARGSQEWTPGLELRPGQNVRYVAEELGATPGVAGYSRFFQLDVDVQTHDAPRPLRALLVGLEAPRLSSLDAVVLVEGRTLDASSGGRELLVGQKLAEQHGIEVGDSLTLSRPPAGTRTECRDGELVASAGGPELRGNFVYRVVGILAKERLGRRVDGELIVADAAWARELSPELARSEAWWVRHDPRIDLESLRSRLASSFSYELNKNVLAGAAADERAFRNGVRMAGLFALVLGLYVIFHTLSMSLLERVREVATLRALGSARGQIARAFFLEALLTTLLAAIAGVGGGLLLAHLLLEQGITTLGTGRSITVFEVPWPEVLALAGIGCAIALAGSIWPLSRLSGANTVAALRGGEQSGDELRGHDGSRSGGMAHSFQLYTAVLLVLLLPALYFLIVPVVGETQAALVGAMLAAMALLALLVALPVLMPGVLSAATRILAAPLRALFPFAGRVAVATMRLSPARVATAAAAIALVAAAVTGLKGLTRALYGEIDQWADAAIVDKLYVRGMEPLRYPELRAALETVPGFVAIENARARSYMPFLLLGMNLSELARHGPLHDDPALAGRFARGDAVILSPRLARHLQHPVGSRVRVATRDGSVRELEVIAVSDAYGYFPHPDERMYGVVDDSFQHKYQCQDIDNLSEFALVLRAGTDPAAAERVLKALAPASRVQLESGRDLKREHGIDLERDFRLFDLILSLTAILAALAVLNGQLLRALERAKELGVLRALGATRRQLAGSVLIESTVTGLLGGGLGTLLGALLTPVVVRALETISGLALPQVGPGPWLLIVPVASVALAWLASVYPILHMGRMDPVRAVRAP